MDREVKIARDFWSLPAPQNIRVDGDEEDRTIPTRCDCGGVSVMIETGGPEPAAIKTVEQNPTKLRFNVEDVEATAAELRRKGVKIEVKSYSWGTIANFTDPDGNLCSLRDEGRFR